MPIHRVTDCETLAGLAPAVETELIPPAATGVELAWSDEAESIPVELRSWRTAWSVAGGLMLVGIVAAVGVALAGSRDGRPPTPAGGPTIMPSPPAPVTIVTTVMIAAPTVPTLVTTTPAPAPTQVIATTPLPEPQFGQNDRAFLARIHQDKLPTDDDADAVVMAHQQCSELRKGGWTMTTLAESMQEALHWTFAQANDFVTDAVTAYCPQLAG